VFKKAFNTELVTLNDREDGGAAGTCADGIDNGGGDGADLADPDHCYKVRADLDPTGAGTTDSVNLLDLLPFKNHFNKACTAL
jgi:hypothetical protein